MLSLSAARPYPVNVNYSTADNVAKAITGSVIYSNGASISIPDSGIAQPYPSVVSAPSIPAGVTALTVTLHGFTHTSVGDLNVLLVGPSGQRIMLMSGLPFVGYAGDLTFSDAGLPFVVGMGSGVVRPSGPSSSSFLPSPAPTGSYGAALSSVLGTNLVGSWKLVSYDGYLRDMGVVAGGWTLTFTTGDYIAANGRVTFPPGATDASIQVPIVNDGIGEANETFYVNLTGAANATIMDGQAVVTIVDDDGGPPPPPPNPLGDVVTDFGGAGLWVLYNPAGAGQWASLHNMNPTLITAANLDGNNTRDLAVVFPGFGLYALLNNTTWVALHGAVPTDVVAADLDGNGVDDLVVNFPGFGIWARYSNGAWVQLHSLNSVALAAANIDGDPLGRADVICSFANAGTWVLKNATVWSQIQSGTATKLRTGDFDGNGKIDILADLPGLGLWVVLQRLLLETFAERQRPEHGRRKYRRRPAKQGRHCRELRRLWHVDLAQQRHVGTDSQHHRLGSHDRQS